jgi:hypothetical protein
VNSVSGHHANLNHHASKPRNARTAFYDQKHCDAIDYSRTLHGARFALIQTRIDISFACAVRRLTATRDDPLSAPSPGGSFP